MSDGPEHLFPPKATGRFPRSYRTEPLRIPQSCREQGRVFPQRYRAFPPKATGQRWSRSPSRTVLPISEPGGRISCPGEAQGRISAPPGLLYSPKVTGCPGAFPPNLPIVLPHAGSACRSPVEKATETASRCVMDRGMVQFPPKLPEGSIA